MAKTIGTFQEWFRESRDADEDWRTKAKENLRFYIGSQWDSNDLQQLKKEKRPALTINKIFPLINFLHGYQIQNRQDISVIALKGATKDEAEVLTECIKHIMDSNEGDDEVTTIFMDGVKTGRGYLGGATDYSEDPIHGDFKLVRQKPLDIYPDPRGERYDLSDCEYICRTVWNRMDWLREEFPDKAKELSAGRIEEKTKISFRGGEKDKYETSPGSMAILHDSQVLVEEYWYKTREPVWYVVTALGILPFTDKGSINDALQKIVADGGDISRIQVIERKQEVLNFATVVGNIILKDEEKPLGEFNQFPFIPYFPYREDRDEEITKDNTLGVIDNIKDLQREVNKRRSQQLNIVNTMAHSGWKNKKTGGANKKDLENFGSTPGAVIEYDETPPEEITPKAPSQGHILTEEKAATDMKETSGINPDLLGYRGERGEPGIVIQMRQQQGAVILEGMINNLKRSKKLLGKALIGLITKSGMYTEQEILSIIDNAQDPRKQQAVKNLLSNKQLRKFDVTVTTQPNAPSQRMFNFYKLTEAAKGGLPIPPQVIVKAGDFPYQEEILAYIQEMQGGGKVEAHWKRF